MSKIDKHEIWESVLFAVLNFTQKKLEDKELDPSEVMNFVWVKCIEIMDAKRNNIAYEEQHKILGEVVN